MPYFHAFEKYITKTELYNSSNYINKLYTRLSLQMLLHILEDLWIVTHLRFQLPPFYVMLTTLCLARL